MNKQNFLNSIDTYITMYEDGLSLKAITEIAGGSSTRAISWVSKTLKQHGLVLRTKSEDNRNRFNYTLNSDAFIGDFSDESSSYFLGFIVADGSLSMDRLSITINQKDGYILKEFQKFLGMNYGYSERSVFDKRTGKYYHRATLAVKCDKLVKSLNAQNIYKSKSAEEKLPNIDWLNNRHFWRGVVDGDGHVNDKPAVLVLVGSKEIVEGFITFCSKAVGFLTERKAVGVKGKNKTLYHVQITGDDARNIAEYLYKDSSHRLERKFNKTRCGVKDNGADPNSTSAVECS